MEMACTSTKNMKNTSTTTSSENGPWAGDSIPPPVILGYNPAHACCIWGSFQGRRDGSRRAQI
jgi:hypothetical protein